MKLVDYSETIAASDLKVCRSRHLIEFIRLVSIEGQGRAQGRVHTKIQTRFSQKLVAVLNQILYEIFQVQGNENLITRCWSHDQDGHHAHIW